MTKRTPNLGLIMPTEEEDREITEAALSDPDALPATDEEMDRMVPFHVLFGYHPTDIAPKIVK